MWKKGNTSFWTWQLVTGRKEKQLQHGSGEVYNAANWVYEQSRQHWHSMGQFLWKASKIPINTARKGAGCGMLQVRGSTGRWCLAVTQHSSTICHTGVILCIKQGQIKMHTKVSRQLAKIAWWRKNISTRNLSTLGHQKQKQKHSYFSESFIGNDLGNFCHPINIYSVYISISNSKSCAAKDDQVESLLLTTSSGVPHHSRLPTSGWKGSSCDTPWSRVLP